MAGAHAPASTNTRLGVAAAALAVVSWGAGGLLVKAADAPGLVFALYRLWISVGAMVLLLVLTGRKLRFASLRQSAPAGVLFGLNMACFFSSVKLTSIADATLIAALQPALVLLVAGRWFGERVGRREVLYTVIALVGVVLVVAGSSATPEWSAVGDALAVAAMLLWTAYFLYSKHVREEIEPLEYMTGVTIVGALVMTPMAIVSGQDLRALGGTDWLWVALTVLLPGFGGHVLMTWAHRYVDVSLSSLLTVGTPVVAVAGATLLLDEQLTLLQAVGGVVVVTAIAATVWRRRVIAQQAWDAAEPIDDAAGYEPDGQRTVRQ